MQSNAHRTLPVRWTEDIWECPLARAEWTSCWQITSGQKWRQLLRIPSISPIPGHPLQLSANVTAIKGTRITVVILILCLWLLLVTLYNIWEQKLVPKKWFNPVSTLRVTLKALMCLVEREIYWDLFGWNFLHFRANFERKRVWSLIGQWTVHRFPTSLIGREAAFVGFRW